MSVALKPSHNPRADLTPLRALLSDGRWWRLFEITSALGLSRHAAQRRLTHALEDGWLEKSCNGYRLIERAPAIRRADPLRGAPRGADGKIAPVSVVAPVVHLGDRVWMLRPGRAPRLWWPSVPEHCGTCGGATYLEPPLHEPGRVLCHSCSREVVEVRL